MPAAVKSAFDVAFWFLDTALEVNEFLQPQKLHRLLFLAQAYYVVAYEGKRMMPAVFVADEMGPIEPNVYAAFSNGRPNVEPELFLPPDVEQVLASVWRRFGDKSSDRLTHLTKETLAYRHAFRRGNRAEIPLDEIHRSFARGAEAPAAEQVIRPKVMRTQSGRTVAVKAWTPGLKTVPPES